jgi:4,5-dihydroxyphthalate decarboxylase
MTQLVELVDLTVALSSYDHTLDLTKGDVKIAGTRPNFIELPIPEMFRRFVKYREWDVSEISLVKYAMLRAAGDDELVAIPVFTSRMFRHGSIYVRSDRIREPLDLRGARIGIPEWANSAGVWARGLLADMYGLSPYEMEWWQGGVDRPGRPSVLDAPALPAGFELHRAVDRSLEEMIWAGDLDALIVPSTPKSLRVSAESGGAVQRLFTDVTAAERAYYTRTRCLPPMHTIAVRRDVLDAYPWVAGNLYRAFEVAKRRYFVRLTEISASRTAIPWAAAYVAGAQALLGEDFWPYGVDANRTSLDVFLRYCAEQGLLERPLSVDELFAPVEPFVDGLI